MNYSWFGEGRWEGHPQRLYSHGRRARHHFLGYNVKHSRSRTFISAWGSSSLIYGWNASVAREWSTGSLEPNPKVPFLNPLKKVRYGSVIGYESQYAAPRPSQG
jgi:hypothetical protein